MFLFKHLLHFNVCLKRTVKRAIIQFNPTSWTFKINEVNYYNKALRLTADARLQSYIQLTFDSYTVVFHKSAVNICKNGSDLGRTIF